MYCLTIAPRKLSLLAVSTSLIAASAAVAGGTDWPTLGGGAAFQRYSDLSEIDAPNFHKLKILWTRPAVDKIYRDAFPDLNPSAYLRGTPVIVDGTGYVSDGIGMVEAFDAETGATKWVQTPIPVDMRHASGDSKRTVAHWEAGADKRILSIRGQMLYALDAETGKPIKDFGDDGAVYLGWPSDTDYFAFGSSMGPTVAGDVVIVAGTGGVDGQGMGDSGDRWHGHPDDLRGYDVRTGRLIWTFHIIPRPGEPGFETWKSDAWKRAGAQGVWGPISVDPELGVIYAPTSAPTLQYGGFREGDNLYSSSLLAIDAKTGKLVWHYQMIHHDIWDYDNAAPPVLGDITVDGRPIKAVMQANKTGFLFVFDRTNGKPVWPIVERPVPQSSVPGEHSAATQPFPSKPPAFSQQGVADADLMDLSPALKKEARAVASQYVLGPLFTPPSLIADGKKGSLIAPGVWGAGNWNTGAFDPETGRYYAVSRNVPTTYGMAPAKHPDAQSDYIVADQRNKVDDHGKPVPPDQHGSLPQPVTLSSGLPIVKPPYNSITAYDMGKGSKLWSVANGDDATIRSNPALKGVKLPPRLGDTSRVPLLVTKTLLLSPQGSSAVMNTKGVDGPAVLTAYDKATGRVIASVPLPAGATGAPISYKTAKGQRILLPISSTATGGQWVVLALP